MRNRLVILAAGLLLSAFAGPIERISLQRMSDEDIRASINLLEAELRHRESVTSEFVRRGTAILDVSSDRGSSGPAGLPAVQWVHKSTYATADPPAAAAFAKHYLGADLTEPNRHQCGVISTARWSSANHGEEFCLHFVYNPNKVPGPATFNATNLGRSIERLRGKTFVNDTFDQFMDTHVGIVVPSLDPFVRLWRDNGIPFQCRTWCCAAGMPQFEQHRCPTYSYNRTGGCETGCYVQIPSTGFVVEMQCGLDGYNASRSCLTLAEPETFDLCNEK